MMNNSAEISLHLSGVEKRKSKITPSACPCPGTATEENYRRLLTAEEAWLHVMRSQ
jgi:hypothetical protein